jgi:hypothetical protein
MKSKGIVMFHIGRSGSTVLCDMLAQNPLIAWEEEPFEPLYSGDWRGRKLRLMGHLLKAAPFVGLRLKRLSSSREWFGFDVKFYHWRDRKIPLVKALVGLQSIGYRDLIVLRRENYLRKVVSSVVALAHGSYHTSATGDRSSRPKVNLDVSGILIDGDRLPLLERFAHWDADFDELYASLHCFRHLCLTYEEDVMNDVNVAYRKVCEFLDVEVVPVESRLKRTNPYPLVELISNWEEVCSCLTGTRWEWMLETP